jgi:CheY-like chemotaxis protein
MSPSDGKQREHGEGGTVPRGSYTVLVVDDDAAFRQFVSSMLQKNGFVVLAASSGDEALDVLSGNAADVRVVLLDYSMPGLSGAETLQRLRALIPAVKIVALSSSIPQFVTPSFLVGVDGYLEKPIHTQELIATIDAVVGSEPPA